MRTKLSWGDIEVAGPDDWFCLVQVTQVLEEMSVPDFLVFQGLQAFVSHAFEGSFKLSVPSDLGQHSRRMCLQGSNSQTQK